MNKLYLKKPLFLILVILGTVFSSFQMCFSYQSLDTVAPDMVPTFSENISDWFNRLPDVDWEKDEYIAIPSIGLIMPINHIPVDSNDYFNFKKWRQININTYLRNGVVIYPGWESFWYGENGSKILFWHSSYFKNDSGRYKTHFQKIIDLPEGTEIWIFQKQSDGNYKKFAYEVIQSFATSPKNSDILESIDDQSLLTLVTCYPIGTIQSRWIVVSRFIELPVVIEEIEPEEESQVLQLHEELDYNSFVNIEWTNEITATWEPIATNYNTIHFWIFFKYFYLHIQSFLDQPFMISFSKAITKLFW